MSSVGRCRRRDDLGGERGQRAGGVVVGVGEVVGAGAFGEPGFQDGQVGDGEYDREEERLGDLSGGGPVFGVADVERPALEAAVCSLVVAADGPVGVQPGRVEVGDVLAVLGQTSVGCLGVGGHGDRARAAHLGHGLRRWGREVFGFGDVHGGAGRCGEGPAQGVAEVDRSGGHRRGGRSAGPKPVTAGAVDRRGGTGSRALQAYRPTRIRAFLELEVVRGEGFDLLAEFVAAEPDGVVVGAGSGVDEWGGGERAQQRSVDERGSLPAALQTAFLDLVVQGEPVAEAPHGVWKAGGLQPV